MDTSATKSILAIIPARSGSKGVTGKNVRKLYGKPLIEYSIECANLCSEITDAVVSTDDETMANIARACGGHAPFLRPKNLAEDHTPMLPVLVHALNFMERQKGIKYHYILILQPTSPLRSPQDIKEAISLMNEHPDADSVVSVVKVSDAHPVRMKRIVDGELHPYYEHEPEGTPRQELPDAYLRNGAIYLIKRDSIVQKKSIFGTKTIPLIMPPLRSVNIDEEIDFLLAETLIKLAAKQI